MMIVVLFCLDIYNKIPGVAWVSYKNWVSHKNRNLLLTVLEAEKAKIKVSVQSLSGGGPSSWFTAGFSLCPQMVEVV